jgi:hypothetical protein
MISFLLVAAFELDLASKVAAREQLAKETIEVHGVPPKSGRER